VVNLGIINNIIGTNVPYDLKIDPSGRYFSAWIDIFGNAKDAELVQTEAVREIHSVISNSLVSASPRSCPAWF
jgi:hypothetical protein